MPQFKKYKLRTLCTKIGSGATPRGGDAVYKAKGISLIRSQNILDFAFSKNGLAFIDEEQAKDLANVELKERDVLLNITGDSVARVSQVPNKILPARVNQHVAIIRANQQKLNPEYLKYYLLSRPTKEMLLSLASTGATRKAITKSMIEDFEIEIPDEEGTVTQTLIASILTSLDDKIELNRRTNHTLEQIAQTLFKKYFVDDIDPENLPKGWVKNNLKEFVTTTTGYSYKSTELQPSKRALVTLKNFDRNGGFRLDGFKQYIGGCKETQIVQEGDLAVAHTDVTQNAELIGNPILIINPDNYDQLVISTDLVKVESKLDWLTLEYLYYLMRDSEFKNHCLAHTNGTTVLHLSKSAIPTYIFNLPNKETIAKFTEVVRPIIQKKNCNIRQNNKLIALRDSLLPKLMSGEIEVNSTEKELAEV